MNLIQLSDDDSRKKIKRRVGSITVQPCAVKTHVTGIGDKDHAHSFPPDRRCDDVRDLIKAKQIVLGDEPIRVLLALCDQPFESHTKLCDHLDIWEGNASKTISELIKVGLVKSEKGFGKSKRISLAVPPESIHRFFGSLKKITDGNGAK